MSETQENPHLNKAQQDKERFLESKKGLLPEFEFPQDETKPDKEYSPETLRADIMEEKIESVKEIMHDSELIDKAIENLKANARSEYNSHAAWAFQIYSALLESQALTPEQIIELKETIYNPELITNAIEELKSKADIGNQGDEFYAAFAFRIYSSLLKTEALTTEQITELKETMDNSELITNAIEELKSDADEGSQGDKDNAAYAFEEYPALLKSEALTPEQAAELKPIMHNPELLTNAIEGLKSEANKGSASWAFRTYSSLLKTQVHLRQEGKAIDEAKFAKEALEQGSDKNIPPRPEMRSY